jgi:molybdenum cofactor cytidylyltransferase
MVNIPILLLAAGQSKRMGHPKALLPWGETSLIENRITEFSKTNSAIIVVLGADSEKIMPLIQKYKIDILVNNNWESGIASSISSGIKHIEKNYPTTHGVLIALMDQPFVSANHLQTMLKSMDSNAGKIIVSQSEKGWQGAPALFDKIYFSYLKELKGDLGAKSVIESFRNDTFILKSHDNLEDIDTEEHYKKMADINRLK